jgi:hypothetical protein
LLDGQLGSLASAHVGCMRDWFKVLRINARRVAAQMIEGESFWNGANRLFVNVSVRKDDFATDSECSISGGALGGCPYPTTSSLVYLITRLKRATRPEPSTGNSVRAGLAPSGVVGNSLATIGAGFGRMEGHSRLQSGVPRPRPSLAVRGHLRVVRTIVPNVIGGVV